jgi:hypothetical protein
MSGVPKMKTAIFDKKYWNMFADYLLENTDLDIELKDGKYTKLIFKNEPDCIMFCLRWGNYVTKII